KHFEVPISATQRRRVETRVLVHQGGDATHPARWFGVTYRWRADQTDADLLTAPLDETIGVDSGGGLQQQPYHYPAPWECLQCHNAAAGDVLGLRTAQMNRSFAYPAGAANQLATFWCAGILDRDPGNPAGHETLVNPTDANAS